MKFYVLSVHNFKWSSNHQPFIHPTIQTFNSEFCVRAVSMSKSFVLTSSYHSIEICNKAFMCFLCHIGVIIMNDIELNMNWFPLTVWKSQIFMINRITLFSSTLLTDIAVWHSLWTNCSLRLRITMRKISSTLASITGAILYPIFI